MGEQHAELRYPDECGIAAGGRGTNFGGDLGHHFLGHQLGR